MTDETMNNDAREAMDRLNESNRLLSEARMLPANKPLTLAQSSAVVERFSTYIEERDILPGHAAREIGYAPSVISQWVKNTYRGDVDAVTRAVNTWMERDARRSEAKRPKEYVTTWIAESMRSVIQQADKQMMMAAIVAPAGAGKTMVLKAICDELRALYVYCDENISSKELVKEIASQLGKPVTGGSRSTLLNMVCEALAGTKRLILLDEAHRAGKALGVIRSIYDRAGVPIVMAGTSDMLRLIDDRSDGRGQFSSRCMRFNLLDEVYNAEAPDGGQMGRDLFTVDEVRAFFTSKQMRLADDAIMFAWALACLPNHGAFRLIEKVAATACDLNRSATVLTREHLAEALTMFRGSREAKYMVDVAKRQLGRVTTARVA